MLEVIVWSLATSVCRLTGLEQGVICIIEVLVVTTAIANGGRRRRVDFRVMIVLGSFSELKLVLTFIPRLLNRITVWFKTVHTAGLRFIC